MHLNNKVAVLDILKKEAISFPAQASLFDFSQTRCGYGYYIHKIPFIYVIVTAEKGKKCCTTGIVLVRMTL